MVSKAYGETRYTNYPRCSLQGTYRLYLLSSCEREFCSFYWVLRVYGVTRREPRHLHQNTFFTKLRRTTWIVPKDRPRSAFSLKQPEAATRLGSRHCPYLRNHTPDDGNQRKKLTISCVFNLKIYQLYTPVNPDFDRNLFVLHQTSLGQNAQRSNQFRVVNHRSCKMPNVKNLYK